MALHNFFSFDVLHNFPFLPHLFDSVVFILQLIHSNSLNSLFLLLLLPSLYFLLHSYLIITSHNFSCMFAIVKRSPLKLTSFSHSLPIIFCIRHRTTYLLLQVYFINEKITQYSCRRFDIA